MTDHLKLWNTNQKLLRDKLPKAVDFDEMKQLLLTHHAMLHASTVTEADVWSYEDKIWQGLQPTDLRRILPKQDHSIIWIIWHIARIEDITMNILLAGTPQVLQAGEWQNQMKIPFRHTGNEISAEDMAVLNESIDFDALKAYRVAVGQRTQAIIQTLEPDMVCQKVDPARIQQLRDSGGVLPAAYGIIEYWSKRDIAGLLLMPATRHNLVHLNEAARIKQKLLK